MPSLLITTGLLSPAVLVAALDVVNALYPMTTPALRLLTPLFKMPANELKTILRLLP